MKFSDQPLKKFKTDFTSASQKIISQHAAGNIKSEEIVIIDDVVESNTNPVKPSQVKTNMPITVTSSDESDDENYSEKVGIPKDFRQKIFVHKTLSKKQSQILTDRNSNKPRKGIVLIS